MVKMVRNIKIVLLQWEMVKMVKHKDNLVVMSDLLNGR